MVFFEALQALANLDTGFFVDIVMDNIIWFFAFYAVVHYFFDGKKSIVLFVYFSFLIWAFLDFGDITGLAFISASFLLINYISKLAALAWAENSPVLRHNLVIVSEVLFFSLLITYTFFLG